MRHFSPASVPRAPRLVTAFLTLALACGHPLRAQVPAGRRPYAAAKYGGNYMHSYLIPPAPSASPWLPSWSPDGRWLAVGMGGSIWRVELDGRATELVAGPRYYASPAVSPDGRWLVYTADDGGRTIQLEALELASGRTLALTDDRQVYLDPRWSPDGGRLAYVTSQPNGFFNVVVRAIRDGQFVGEGVQVTEDSQTPGERPYFTARDMHITPAWHPSGDTLLLVSNRGVALGSGRVVRVPVRAGGLSAAQVVLDEQTLYQARPDVSPDGTRMVYASSGGGRRHAHDLFVRALDGGAPRPLTRVAYDALQPRWSPDGRTVAFVGNRSGMPQLALLDVGSGTIRELAIGARSYRRPMATLQLHVSTTGTDTVAARVHLTGSDGKLHAPVDAFARQSWMNDRVFHTAGTTTIVVPAGRTRLEVVKGFEFRPTRLELDLADGETRPVTVTLARVADMEQRGWIAGSTGVHMHDAGPLRASLEALMPMAAAEGVTLVANPLAHHDDRLSASDFWVAGRGAHRASGGEGWLTLGQEHRPGFYGHVALFGTDHRLRSLYDVTIGYEGNPGPSLGESNTDVLRAARARGAFTAYVHAFSGEDDPMQAALGLGKGYIVDATLGAADAIEWASAGRGGFIPWYAMLNNGVRSVALGGEDTIANLHIMRLLGAVRTYAACRRADGADGWWNAVRGGRAFVTTGPLVDLVVDGVGVGGERALPAGGGTVRAQLWVRSITPLQKVLLVQNGAVVAEFTLPGDRTALDTTVTLPVTRSGWVHLRAEGAASERAPLDALYAQAFTNPTWLTVGGAPPRDRDAADYALRWIDMLQVMADAWPGWTSASEKQHVFGQFDEARDRLRAWRGQAEAGVAGPARPDH